jgi:four helix bundle protein
MQGNELRDLAYMEKRRNDLCERLLRFSIDVVLYLRTVKNTIETMDIKRQLIRASTSSGANYEESKGSPTRPDVKTKIGISLKEMRESNYFLKLFDGLEWGDSTQCKYLVKESEELKKILASILNKM